MATKTPASRMTEISTITGHEVDYKVTHTSGAVHKPEFTMQGTYRGTLEINLGMDLIDFNSYRFQGNWSGIK